MGYADTLRAFSRPISRLSLHGGAGYLFAVAMICLAASARWMLPEELGDRVPFPTFFLAVFVSAWVAGLRAGLLASALTLLAGLVVFPISADPLNARDLLALSFVFLVCLSGTIVCARLRASIDLIERDRAWYHRILDNVGDAVLVIDADGRLRYFNRHAATLWQLDRSQISVDVSQAAPLWHEGSAHLFADVSRLLNGGDQQVELPPGLEVRTAGSTIAVTGNVSRFEDPEHGIGAVISVQSITELREVWARLEASERRLQSLIGSDIVGLFSVDVEGRLLATNAALLSMLGYSSSEPQLLPTRIEQIAPAATIALIQRQLGPVESAGTADCQLLHRDRNLLWVSMGATQTSANERTVLVAEAQARKSAEQALAAKESELRLILNAMPARTAYIDRAGLLLWANRSFAAWFALDDVRGVSLDAAFPDDVARLWRAALSDAFNGATAEVEWWRDHPKLGPCWTTTTFSADIDASGSVRGVISLCIDSTERHDTEEALRRSDAEHRTLVENVPHMVWMAEASGKVEYFNSRWYEFTRSEDSGHWTEAILESDRVTAIAAFDAAIAEKTDMSVEVRYRRGADGVYRWHLVRAMPLFDDDGNITRWYGTCTDIDDQKAAQETLREANVRSNHFLATLSHELRNPLAALTASAHLLDHVGASTTVWHDATKTIQRQTLHLKRLVDDLLDISRITHGKIQFNHSVFDIADICRDAAADFGEQAAARGVRIECFLPDQPIYIRADSARIRQCVDNLVSNAIKASGDTMTVSIDASQHNGFAEISVMDTGVGISDATIGTIFQPFTQSEDWRNKGLGLGLSIVHRMVELHGGTLEVKSPGRNLGARFLIRLPIANDVQPVVVLAEPIAADVDGERGVVLIVDDEVDNAQALQYLLELEGHVVHTAEDGLSALILAPKIGPDVILCDLGLPPPLSGYDVARRVRPLIERPVYLCAYSGYGAQEDLERSAAAGFDAHITKPSTPRVIIAEIRKGIDKVRKALHPAL